METVTESIYFEQQIQLLNTISQLQIENNNLISINNQLLGEVRAISNSQASYVHVFLWLVFVLIAVYLTYRTWLLIKNILKHWIWKNF